tara:strand:+ start:2084 stop:3007 length:924 start_codon:yes stop_codon:yes gene_type:complete
MNVALFGATGFVGSYFVKELISNSHTPKALIRPGSEKKLVESDKCEIVLGDVGDLSAVKKVVEGADAVIYNIGIIRQFPKKGITFDALHFQGAKTCIEMAKKLGIKRFILMSANGVKPTGTSYQRTKYLAEQYLINSGLDWTIFRPSLIFGNPENKIEFCSQLRDDMLNLPVPAPLFYDGLLPIQAGQFAMSPIHVTDVAKCFVKTLELDSTVSKTYHLGGTEYIIWKDMISIISTASGKKKWKIPAPVLPIKILASILDRFSWFPITKDQLTMLMEGNTCDALEASIDFEFEPMKFNKGSLKYLAD